MDRSRPPRPAVRLRDFVEVLYSPTAVFLRTQGTKFWFPLAAAVVALWLMAILALQLGRPMLDEIWRVRAPDFAARYPFASAASLEAERASRERLIPILLPAMLVLLMTVASLAGWVAGRIAGAKQSVRSAFIVTGFSAIPVVLGAFLFLVELFLRGGSPSTHNWNLALFLEPTNVPERIRWLLYVDAFLI